MISELEELFDPKKKKDIETLDRFVVVAWNEICSCTSQIKDMLEYWDTLGRVPGSYLKRFEGTPFHDRQDWDRYNRSRNVAADTIDTITFVKDKQFEIVRKELKRHGVDTLVTRKPRKLEAMIREANEHKEDLGASRLHAREIEILSEWTRVDAKGDLIPVTEDIHLSFAAKDLPVVGGVLLKAEARIMKEAHRRTGIRERKTEARLDVKRLHLETEGRVQERTLQVRQPVQPKKVPTPGHGGKDAR